MVGRLVLLTEATALRESGSKERRNLQTHASVGGTRQSHIRVDGRTQGVPEGEHPGATSDPGKRSYSRLKLLVNEFILLRPFTAGPCAPANTPPGPPPLRRTWHSLTETHRHYPFTARWPTHSSSGQVPKKRAPLLLLLWLFFSFYCQFVETSTASATTSPLVSSDHQTFTRKLTKGPKQRRRPDNKGALL